MLSIQNKPTKLQQMFQVDCHTSEHFAKFHVNQAFINQFQYRNYVSILQKNLPKKAVNKCIFFYYVAIWFYYGIVREELKDLELKLFTIPKQFCPELIEGIAKLRFSK